MQLFVDNLTNVDFSYLDPHQGLLGQTWLTDVTLEGSLDQQGMVCDFGTVKGRLRDWLDRDIDHRLLVPLKAKNLTLEEDGDALALTWKFGDGLQLYCSAPRQAITLVETTAITPATLSQWCSSELQKHLPRTVDELKLVFREEAIDGACYQYSHGLKKHEGNCQRIAHGHRSRIHIWRDDMRAPDLESQWATSWRAVYIGTAEDLTQTSEERGVVYYHFAYQSQQGQFKLSIPQSCCYLLETDTTVEFIADHIARQLKVQHPDSRITVKAYEGLGKGAIAQCD